MDNDFKEVGQTDSPELAEFGFSLVSDLDYWARYGIDFVMNSKPAQPFVRENDLSKEDEYFRNSFSSLEENTKDAICQLICKVASGVVFSILVNFDQYPSGELSITLKPKDSQRDPISLTSPEFDIHDKLSEWIESYSKMRESFIVVEGPPGMQSIRLK